MWIHYKPSLFQHIGTHSSLKGKVSAATLTRYILIIRTSYFFITRLFIANRIFQVQKLKDRQFGRVQLFVPHKNPPATIGTYMYIQLKHNNISSDKNDNNFNPLSESPIKHYKHYSITRAYQGETFFWGLVPQVKTFSFKENTT